MFPNFNYLQHCISCTAVQKITQITQLVGNVNKDYRLQKVVFDNVCLCWCFVLGQRLRETFGLTSERVAGGWTKLHSEELHVLYCWVNVGGRWTERQWDRWDKRNGLEKLKVHTTFHFENLRGRGTMENLGQDEKLKTMWWTGHKRFQFQFAFRWVQYKFFRRNISSANWTHKNGG